MSNNKDYMKIIFRLLDIIESKIPDEDVTADAIGFEIPDPNMDDIIDPDVRRKNE